MKKDELAVAAAQYVEEKQYWLDRLAGSPPASAFPHDDINPDEQDGAKDPGVESVRITGGLFHRLMGVANDSDIRLHMVLTAGLVALLYRHTGGTDIITGMPVYREDAGENPLNTILALRLGVNGDMTFKELLFQVRDTIEGAVTNQNYPFDILADQLAPAAGGFPLFDTAILLENIHDGVHLTSRTPAPALVFSCFRGGRGDGGEDGKGDEGYLQIRAGYSPARYRAQGVRCLLGRFLRLLEVVHAIDSPLGRIDILPEAEHRLLDNHGRGPVEAMPPGKTLPDLIRGGAAQHPDRPAFTCGDEQLTYRQLEDQSDALAKYLGRRSPGPEERVGVMTDRSLHSAVAILGAWKAGCAYVPIDTGLPEKRIAEIINNAGIRIVLSEKRYIKTLNSLQWICPGFRTFLCLDSRDIYAEEEVEKSGLMDPQLWEYVGQSAEDDIMGGGWINSYTGDHFSRAEVDEFADNLDRKLKPILHEKIRILEIGCASGISMYRIAPLTALYYGTDISRVIIEKNRTRVREEGIDNIALAALAAHEIDTIEEKDFDLVIINSVIQDFHGHNYLRRVIGKAVDKLGHSGHIFIGDVMDQDRKQELIDDLLAFKRANRDKKYKTKTNWDAELFLSRDFFSDLAWEIPGIRGVEFSDKYHTIKNELTQFRYDVMIRVEKENKKANKKEVKKEKAREQHDVRDLERAVAQVGAGAVSYSLGPDHLAYVIYTSGSTGSPKGAMIEHGGMLNHILAKTRDLQLTAQDTVAQNSPLAFDISIWQFFAALAVGGTTRIYADDVVFDPGRFLSHLARDPITILEVVPSYLTLMLDQVELKPTDLEPLRFLLVTGETVSAALVRRWFATYPGIKMVNAYGPTEASDDITHHIMDRPPAGERIPIGRPLRNFRIYIVDRDMNPCPPGVKGEICVSGAAVGRGYLGDDKRTALAFMPDPFQTDDDAHGTSQGTSHPTRMHRRMYRTGDLGRWAQDGTIEFFGRIDHQVKLRGFRIELGEIESKLTDLPEVKEAVAVLSTALSGDSAESGQGAGYIAAYVVLDRTEVPGDFNPEDLKEFLRGQLPDYMIPRYFVAMDTLPLTVNGKVDRKKLPPVGRGAIENQAPPENDTQRALVDILAGVLSIAPESIGIRDNFFDLGADSLTILNLQYQVNKSFGYNLSLGVLFLYPTVEELAQNIHEESTLNGLECIVKLNNGRNRRNLFLVHPMHGMVYQYRDLADSLKDRFNVYGIQARGFMSDNGVPAHSRQLVADYVQQIRTVQEEGPYLIAGYCVGALIGYEIVKQLEIQGHDVGAFIVLDEPAFIPTRTLKYLPLADVWGIISGPVRKCLTGMGIIKPYMPPEFKPEHREELKNIHYSVMKQEQIEEGVIGRVQDRRVGIEEALSHLKIKISGLIKADLLSIKAAENHEGVFDLGHYRKMTRGKAYLEETAGTHTTMFFPPAVGVLASTIVKMLDQSR